MCVFLLQEDFSEDDVMMLDNGSVVYLWFGRNASEIEKKLSLKSVQVIPILFIRLTSLDTHPHNTHAHIHTMHSTCTHTTHM